MSDGKVKIPLDTEGDYFCTPDGRVFRDKKELKGWKHYFWHPKNGYDYSKVYLRFSLSINVAKPDKPKKFKKKQFYGQRLVAMCFHNLLIDPTRIVRHLSGDSLNNHKDFIVPGTQLENQGVDRLEQGTYWNRGGG